MLKQAFNSIAAINSRTATLKRTGPPDLYSPISVVKSEYFRYLNGPGALVFKGREFIIPIDSIKGTSTQLVSFDDVPTVGTYTLTYNSIATTTLNFDAVAADIQAALRAVPLLEAVTVSGDTSVGFTVVFLNLQSTLTLIATPDGMFVQEITIANSTPTPWPLPIIKRADKILDSIYGILTVDEIIEMSDLGGAVMGFRVRTN